MENYVLDGAGNPVREPDILKWGRWYETAKERIVERTTIGDATVSTVFLAKDHRWWGEPGPPILWETMIFGSSLDQYCERYTSVEDARAGHKKACALARRLQIKPVS